MFTSSRNIDIAQSSSTQLAMDALGDDALPFPYPRLPWDRLASLVAEADSKNSVSGYGKLFMRREKKKTMFLFNIPFFICFRCR
jgi:hypothetical protein